MLLRDILGIVSAMPNLSHLAIHGGLRMSDSSYYEDLGRERTGDGVLLQVRIYDLFFLSLSRSLSLSLSRSLSLSLSLALSLSLPLSLSPSLSLIHRYFVIVCRG